ncbi:uncharacterized protein TNCV_516601 [Trichonephila clavipes]|nr:uncharacterized protein TNCV_516601 [Trichonephila clavipes]
MATYRCEIEDDLAKGGALDPSISTAPLTCLEQVRGAVDRINEISGMHKVKLGGSTPVAAVAEWYRYRIAGFVTSCPVPLKTRRVGQRCSLNLSRAQTSSRWCGVVVRRGGASSDVIHVT